MNSQQISLHVESSHEPEKVTKFYQMSLDDLFDYYKFNKEETATKLGICTTLLQKRCRELGIKRWPHRVYAAIMRCSNISLREILLKRLRENPNLVLKEHYPKKLREYVINSNKQNVDTISSKEISEHVNDVDQIGYQVESKSPGVQHLRDVNPISSQVGSKSFGVQHFRDVNPIGSQVGFKRPNMWDGKKNPAKKMPQISEILDRYDIDYVGKNKPPTPSSSVTTSFGDILSRYKK